MDMFVLTYGYDYDHDYPAGAYGTLEEAKAAADAWFAGLKFKPDYMGIYRFTVGAVPTPEAANDPLVVVYRSIDKEWK